MTNYLQVLLISCLCCATMAQPPVIPSAWITEAQGWYQDSLRINTADDPVPGREGPLLTYIENILNNEGIPFILYNLPYGGGLSGTLLYARLNGTTDEDVLMSSHSDTVTISDMPAWEGLSGNIINGRIYGRGALDMKHKVIYDLATLVWTHRLGLTLERGLIYAVVPGEEIGVVGAFLCAVDPNCASLLSNVVIAFEEVGAMTFVAADGHEILPVSLGDKGPCFGSASIVKEAHHPAVWIPTDQLAILALAQALVQLNEVIPVPHYTPVNLLLLDDLKRVSPQMRHLAEQLRNPNRFQQTMEHVRETDINLFKFLLPQFTHLKSTQSFSAAATSASSCAADASSIIYMVPVPGDPNGCVTALNEAIEAMDNPDINFSLFSVDIPPPLAGGAGMTIDPADPLIVEALSKIYDVTDTIMKNVTVVRAHCAAPTNDIMWHNLLGIPTVGFEPVRFPADTYYMDMFHGTNEWIPLASFVEGIQVHFEVMRRMST